jgi:hypothetical protein
MPAAPITINGTLLPLENLALRVPHTKVEITLSEAVAVELGRELGKRRDVGQPRPTASILVSVDGKEAEPFSLQL